MFICVTIIYSSKRVDCIFRYRSFLNTNAQLLVFCSALQYLNTVPDMWNCLNYYIMNIILMIHFFQLSGCAYTLKKSSHTTQVFLPLKKHCGSLLKLLYVSKQHPESSDIE